MKAKRHLLPAVAAMLFLTEASAQSLQSSMEFLKYPVSAHQAALGGQAVSAADRSASQFLANPALLSEVESGMVGLNAMTWIGNTVIAGAQYGNSLGERTMYGFSARYVDYGSSARTLPDATVTGTFSSKDMAVGISCSYMFTDNLSGIDFLLRVDEELTAVLKVVNGIGKSSAGLHGDHGTVCAALDVALVGLVVLVAVSHDGFAGRSGQDIGAKTDDAA